jgi:hypothetical protein
MALTKPARSKILALVQDAKRLLMKEVEEQLQQYYGIRPDGTVLMIEQLTTSDSDFIYTARVLRQRLDYIKTNLPDKKNEDVEAVRQLVREQAFTILNRFASLRMAEERGIIKETVRKEYNSEGFQVFDSITGQGQTASQYIRYKWYIHAIFDELALDLPSVFDRYSPYALIFPSEQAMNRLLDIINREEITLHREEGIQPVNLWKEDETIGWIYQYYNSREEISAMRDASSAPRNSQELAVRNQFFTPRYVVQFLTDNSLGRIWYEMTEGNTVLKSVCPYIIVRPGEVFLRKGESKPESSDENTVYIEYRAIKDPREIFMLDPACGSMHFGLYCFDLFEHIYTEAWDNYPELLTDLRNNMTRSEFVKQIPELIIRHNIHGVDIDPRALQIAGLSLWLRAQKSFDKQNLSAKQRPQITRSNLVLAEPMPGSIETLSQLIHPLDAPMRKLVLAIWDKMKLAGETGLLLRIEDEIDKTINEIVKELADGKMSTQLSIGSDAIELQAAEKAAIYASKQYREHFLNSAEAEVLKMLKQLAETSSAGDAYQKLLFADDTARGFAFIELSRKKYDVVLMNPPFGSASLNTEAYLQSNYPTWGKNILAAFFERMLELISNEGLVGAIFDRTVAIKSSYEDFRIKCFCGHITAMADTGWNVLDANVETTSLVLNKFSTARCGVFIDLNDFESKDAQLKEILQGNQALSNKLYIQQSITFNTLPNAILGYNWSKSLLDLFTNNKNILNYGTQGRQGHALVSFNHYRTFWEVKNTDSYKHLYNGSSYSLFYTNYRDISKFGSDYSHVKYHKSVVLRNQEYQFRGGVGFGKRGDYFDAHVLKMSSMFTVEGQAISGINSYQSIALLSFLNSSLAQFLLSLYSGQHKSSGYVNLLPFPEFENDFAYIEEIVLRILEIKRKWFSLDETCLEFQLFLFHFSRYSSIKLGLTELIQCCKIDKTEYLQLINKNDSYWNQKSQFDKVQMEILENFISRRPNENLIMIDGLNDDNLNNNPVVVYELISNLIGVAFGRWDVRVIANIELSGKFEGITTSLPFQPSYMLSENPDEYPIQLPEDGILLSDNSNSKSLFRILKEVLRFIWKKDYENITNEIEEIGKISSLEDFVSNPNGFFDFHYKRYTKSRREAPIYWPITSTSGLYTIWIYYPKINDQTLFKIVNDFILPKQQEIAEQIRKLENNPNIDNKGKKELLDNQNLFHELKDMEKDLLGVALLPYKPNHDDGVLITAAPLYKFFRHSKWKKSTEECWKALQKGEYDWAHLAYSIWPDRVAQKCKKDLSMAISHGLEDICEVKPKEKKEKKVAKSTDKNIQSKLID